MKQRRTVAVLIAAVGLIAVSGAVASQLPASITTRHDTSADLIPQPGPMEIVQLILDFAPGAATAPHYHSGTAHNTVLAGEITLRHAGMEQRIGVGQSWTDAPGVVHQAANMGSTQATVSAVLVQPKGAMRTVNVESLQSPGLPLPRALPVTGDGSEAGEEVAAE